MSYPHELKYSPPPRRTPQHGPENLIVCPTAPDDGLDFPTSWYRLPNNDDFSICICCYESKIRNTPLASLLRYDYLDFGPIKG